MALNHEQRLSSLESSQIDTNKNLTILLGIVSEQQKDIKRILRTMEEHTSILSYHTSILGNHTQMLVGHTESLKVIEQALQSLIGEVRDIKAIVTKDQE